MDILTSCVSLVDSPDRTARCLLKTKKLMLAICEDTASVSIIRESTDITSALGMFLNTIDGTDVVFYSITMSTCGGREG